MDSENKRGRTDNEAGREPSVWWKVVIVLALMSIGITAIVAKNRRRSPVAGGVPEHVEIPTDPDPGTPVLPRLLDLGADKCIPCKMMAPILEELREEYRGRFDVEFVDVWEDSSAARRHGVRMIPTQIFFDAAGKELFRHEGFFSREDILNKWKELGIDIEKEREAKSAT